MGWWGPWKRTSGMPTAPEPTRSSEPYHSIPPLRFTAETPTISAHELSPFVRQSSWHGEKFAGGLGSVDLLSMDYWTLRQRSAQLFRTNLYARGIIRRMITNEINVGLHLEATPEEKILGRAEDSLAEWSEDVENRFSLWAGDPWLCDHNERLTFGALQALAKMEALVCGDVLIVLRQYQPTGLPRIQLINGACVQSPLDRTKLREGVRICHGVEMDANDRHIAYWVRQRDGTFKRIPAWGEKSGRRISWLVYGTDKRLDDIRGEPILSLVIQSLKEIDRYRDSIQRKAVVLSMLAMFIEKSEDRPGSRPLTGGAIRKSIETTQDTAGATRSFRAAEMLPGLAMDELQPGEKPVAFQHNGALEKFGDFEEAIIQGVAWGLGVPPEILRLSFSNNYSASQAAINEYKMTLNMLRTRFGEDVCVPVYQEWLIAAALTQKVEADGLLESWRDPKQYDVFGAWVSSDWSSAIKPAVDLSKLVRGYKEMAEEGAITRDRMSRELTGMKFSRVVRRLKLENAQLAAALEPLKKLEASKPVPVVDAEIDDIDREDDDEEANTPRSPIVRVVR